MDMIYKKNKVIRAEDFVNLSKEYGLCKLYVKNNLNQTLHAYEFMPAISLCRAQELMAGCHPGMCFSFETEDGHMYNVLRDCYEVSDRKTHYQASDDEDLINAYKNTNYKINKYPEMIMKVGKVNTLLKKRFTSMATGAFITAENPCSDMCSNADNHTKNQALMSEVKDCGFEYYEGLGVDPSGKWPSEKSILIINIDIFSAIELGDKYQQRAILWIENDSMVHLVLIS